MIKKRIILFILIVFVLSVSVSCAGNFPEGLDLTQNAIEFTQTLIAEEYAECAKDFSPLMKDMLSIEQLEQAYKSQAQHIGTFTGGMEAETQNNGAYQVIDVVSEFEKANLVCTLSYNGTETLEGLWINLQPKKEVPDTSISQVPVTINEGSDIELDAVITKKGGSNSDTAVLLVHGSGPQDMDETISANKPFYDIAIGLAELGVDCMRYNKRTYQHPDKSVETVNEEVIDDAVAAGKLLKQMGYEHVYLAGHSLGGMLALETDNQSGGLFSGIISLAGSPRKLTDIIYDQNISYIESLGDSSGQETRLMLEEQIQLLNDSKDMTEEQLKETTIFGMPGYYINHLNGIDTEELAINYKKPILVLQGDADFQIFADKDFVKWQEVLAGNENAQFKLYEGLNHLFMPTSGKNTIEEYVAPQKVSDEVIEDIANFVLNA